MNKLQELFNFDERITVRRRKRELAVILFYLLFYPHQWKYVRKWLRSLKKENTPYKDAVPWVTFAASDFLEKVLTPAAKVFEYGSGGSTLFFAQRAKEVVSVEHDKPWHEILSRELKHRNINNVSYIFRAPKEITEKQYKHEYFRSWREQNVTFKGYVTSISDYEDNYFNVVSVDGRSRVACLKEAYDKVSSGGYLLLDNSERKDYFEAHLFMRDKGCVPIHFFGLVGYETALSQTTIWKVNK